MRGVERKIGSENFVFHPTLYEIYVCHFAWHMTLQTVKYPYCKVTQEDRWHKIRFVMIKTKARNFKLAAIMFCTCETRALLYRHEIKIKVLWCIHIFNEHLDRCNSLYSMKKMHKLALVVINPRSTHLFFRSLKKLWVNVTLTHFSTYHFKIFDSNNSKKFSGIFWTLYNQFL